MQRHKHTHEEKWVLKSSYLYFKVVPCSHCWRATSLWWRHSGVHSGNRRASPAKWTVKWEAAAIYHCSLLLFTDKGWWSTAESLHLCRLMKTYYQINIKRDQFLQTVIVRTLCYFSKPVISLGFKLKIQH